MWNAIPSLWKIHLLIQLSNQHNKLNFSFDIGGCSKTQCCGLLLIVILIQNFWKDRIFLQRTKVKLLPQDDDAKDDVAGEYELEMYFKLQESSDDTIGSRVNIENHDDAQDWELAWTSKGWGQSAKLGKHSGICSKLGTALQAYTMNPCTKFAANPTSRKVNT